MVSYFFMDPVRVKTIFIILTTHLILSLCWHCVDGCKSNWIKTAGTWTQTLLAIIFSAVSEGKEPVLLKTVISEAVKMISFIKPWLLSTHLLNNIWKKWEVLIKHFSCILRMVLKALAGFWTNPFYDETYSLLEKSWQQLY